MRSVNLDMKLWEQLKCSGKINTISWFIHGIHRSIWFMGKQKSLLFQTKPYYKGNNKITGCILLILISYWSSQWLISSMKIYVMSKPKKSVTHWYSKPEYQNSACIMTSFSGLGRSCKRYVHFQEFSAFICDGMQILNNCIRYHNELMFRILCIKMFFISFTSFI
jgi:hypothetical protein